MKIELRAFSKRYGGVHALKNVSLEILPGQIVALLGANGAGKTTLLRCLAGIAGADKGEFLMDGHPFRRDRLDLRRRIFFIPDSPFLFWDKTVIRNIAITLKLYHAETAGIENKVIGLLRDFDLLPLAERPVAELSRGQIYKTGLVALLAADPEVWLLDEPLASGMDPHGLQAFKRHAKAAVERGRTVFYSTQILEAAERFSDRVCILDQGEVRAFDRLEDLRSRSANAGNVLEQLFESFREKDQ